MEDSINYQYLVEFPKNQSIAQKINYKQVKKAYKSQIDIVEDDPQISKFISIKKADDLELQKLQINLAKRSESNNKQKQF